MRRGEEVKCSELRVALLILARITKLSRAVFRLIAGLLQMIQFSASFRLTRFPDRNRRARKETERSSLVSHDRCNSRGVVIIPIASAYVCVVILRD